MRHKKKSQKTGKARSNHKHNYIAAVICYETYGNKYSYIGKVCDVCGHLCSKNWRKELRNYFAKKNEHDEKELKNAEKTIFLVGDGSNLCYNTLLKSVPNLVMPPEHRAHQRAVGVGLAALKRIAAGDAGDGGSLIPNYLRLSQAERERMERQAAASQTENP